MLFHSMLLDASSARKNMRIISRCLSSKNALVETFLSLSLKERTPSTSPDK